MGRRPGRAKPWQANAVRYSAWTETTELDRDLTTDRTDPESGDCGSEHTKPFSPDSLSAGASVFHQASLNPLCFSSLTTKKAVQNGLRLLFWNSVALGFSSLWLTHSIDPLSGLCDLRSGQVPFLLQAFC